MRNAAVKIIYFIIFKASVSAKAKKFKLLTLTTLTFVYVERKDGNPTDELPIFVNQSTAVVLPTNAPLAAI